MPFYFVAYEYEPGKWKHVPNTDADSVVWETTDATEACGFAAIAVNNRVGHFIAADVDDITSLEVTVQPQAAADGVPFP
jgi:hypothetical protein